MSDVVVTVPKNFHYGGKVGFDTSDYDSESDLP